MSWDSLAWQPADASSLDAGAALLPHWPMIRSALDEAASAFVQGPASVGDLGVARVVAADLPAGFQPVLRIELLGAGARPVWTALDPAGGSTLGGVAVDAVALERALLEGLGSVIGALAGEGLQMAPADDAAIPTEGELLLLRLPLGSPTGDGVVVVAAVEAAVAGELAAHVVALQALAAAPAVPAESTAPDVPAVSAPVAASAGAVGAPPAVPVPQVRPVDLPTFAPAPPVPTSQGIELLLGVQLEVSVEIGRTHLPIRDVLGLAPGSVVELDKLAGEKVDVLVNGRQIATGEVVVVDENFGVRIAEVVARQQRLQPGAPA
ncbi:MAG TPA: flagellar motor switch protein FliN [Candidatus Limnocylindrales bacterium]